MAYAYQGDTDTALDLADRAEHLAAVAANPTARAWADYALGEALTDLEPGTAQHALDRAVGTARAAGNRFVLGVALVSAGSLHTRHGDPAQAARLLGEAVDHWSQAGNWTRQWITLRHVVDLFVRRRAHEQAAVLYGALTAGATATRPYGADATRLGFLAVVLRTELGAELFDAATARGRAMGDDRVVREVRAEIDAEIGTAHTGQAV